MAALPAQTIEFDLRLADAPGTGNHGLSEQPWFIVRSAHEPEGMAMIEPENVVLQGKTDASGAIALNAAEQKTLQEAYCAQPGRLWLMQPGHCARLSVAKESTDWNDEEKLRQYMSATDFSAKVRDHSDGMREQRKYAKELMQTQTSSSLVQRLKKS